MNPRVERVQPNARDYTILIRFTSQEERIFDVKPYLGKGFFRELQDAVYFKRAKVVLGSVQWPHGQDFCPDTLYELSEPVTEYGVGAVIDSLVVGQDEEVTVAFPGIGIKKFLALIANLTINKG